MKSLTLLVPSCCCYFGFSQATFPLGIYMNIKELAETSVDLLHQYDAEKVGLDSNKENGESHLLLKYVERLNTTEI